AVEIEHWHQIFSTREDENVRLFPILVSGQAIVGLTGDGGQGEAPAEAKRSIAGAGVIGERKLRAKARAPWAGGNRHRHGAGASHWIGSEFLAYTPDGAASFGERE